MNNCVYCNKKAKFIITLNYNENIHKINICKSCEPRLDNYNLEIISKREIYNTDPYEKNEGTFRVNKLKNKTRIIGKPYHLNTDTYELEEVE